MLYRYISLTIVASLSLILISAGLTVESSDISTYSPLPTFSGGAGNGGLGDRTGSPLSSATCAQCHAGGAFSSSVSIDVFDPLSGTSLTTEYTPGNTYQVTYTVTGNASAYGFQGTVLTNTNAAGGSFSSPTGAQVVTISGRSYMEHVSGPSVSGVFQSTWTAPAAGSGNVTFYGIGLSVNANGGTSGDNVTATNTFTLNEQIPTTIDFPGTPFCASEPNQTPVVTGETNGTYSASGGLSINSGTGIIDVSNSTPGTYIVDYTYSTGVTSASVTIHPEFTTSSSETICSNETYDFNGQTLTAADAGLNTTVFQSQNGCDSTVNLTLSVNQTEMSSYSETICPGDTYDFNGQILTDADEGLNTMVLQTQNGCDSTVNLTLNVETIDNSVLVAGATITANQTGATYQWVDCDNGNAPIPGETNASFTATTSGNYAVEITLNNCTVTSVCTNMDFSSLDELDLNAIVIFPNPVEDVFEIKNIEKFGVIKSITLTDLTGKVVKQISGADSQVYIGELERGVYYLKIETESDETVVSVVKK